MRQFLDEKRNVTLVQSLLKDATKSGWSVTANVTNDVSKVRGIIKNNGIYAISDIAQTVGI